jgi:hypothetical protein
MSLAAKSSQNRAGITRFLAYFIDTPFVFAKDKKWLLSWSIDRE